MPPRRDRMERFAERTEPGPGAFTLGDVARRVGEGSLFRGLMPSRETTLQAAGAEAPEDDRWGPWQGPGAERAAALMAAGAVPGNLPESTAAPSPGSTPGAPAALDAAGSIKGERAGTAPRGQAERQRPDPGSTDRPLPKVGSGQEAEMDRDVASRDLASVRQGRVRRVERADGSVVFTNLADEDIGPSDRRGEVSGSAGQAYVQPGGEMEAAAAIPDATADRSPGWATQAVYNEAFAKRKAAEAAGESTPEELDEIFSMNPIDIMDRRRWAATREAEETQQEVTKAAAARAIAGPVSEAGMGEQIEQMSIQSRIEEARSAYGQLTAQINALQQLPESPQKKAAIDRLVMERRETTNLLMGFMLKDPRQQDAMAALFASMLGGGAGATSPAE